MKIIIIGSGKVGYTIAQYLSREGNDVSIIDSKEAALSRAEDNLDVICIKGNGLGMRALTEAGAEEADMIIASTSSDEINMLCCLIAKRFRIPHVIARIRDPEYSADINLLKTEIGLTHIMNPELETSREIAQILHFPTAVNVETFVRGKVELVSFKLKNEDSISGQTVSQIMTHVKQSILFCVVMRGNEVIIPDGRFVMQPGDLVHVIGEPSEIVSFFKYIGRGTQKAKNIMIIGGGRIAIYLSKFISESGIQVKIIESSLDRCQSLDEILPDCMIINGDGTDEGILLSEGIGDMDAVVCLTGNDEENLITALYASRLDGPKAIAKINRENYEGISRDLGIDSIISPRIVTAANIIRYVRALKNTIGNNVELLYQIAGGRAEALQFTANGNTQNLDIKLKDIPFKKDVLVAAIVRDMKIIIPSGLDCIKNNDHVILVSTQSKFSDLNDAFEHRGK